MRLLGTVLSIAGLIVALVFALADIVGLGHDPQAFGNRQITGTLVGAVVFIVGFVLRGRAGGAGGGGA